LYIITLWYVATGGSYGQAGNLAKRNWASQRFTYTHILPSSQDFVQRNRDFTIERAKSGTGGEVRRRFASYNKFLKTIPLILFSFISS
jgi:hypothetical protein